MHTQKALCTTFREYGHLPRPSALRQLGLASTQIPTFSERYSSLGVGRCRKLEALPRPLVFREMARTPTNVGSMQASQPRRTKKRHAEISQPSLAPLGNLRAQDHPAFQDSLFPRPLLFVKEVDERKESILFVSMNKLSCEQLLKPHSYISYTLFRYKCQLRFSDDLIDKVVVFCLFSTHPKVSIEVLFDLRKLLTGAFGKNFVQFLVPFF